MGTQDVRRVVDNLVDIGKLAFGHDDLLHGSLAKDASKQHKAKAVLYSRSVGGMGMRTHTVTYDGDGKDEKIEPAQEGAEQQRLEQAELQPRDLGKVQRQQVDAVDEPPLDQEAAVLVGIGGHVRSPKVGGLEGL